MKNNFVKLVEDINYEKNLVVEKLDGVEQKKLIPIIKGLGVDMKTSGDFTITKPIVDNKIDVFYTKSEEGIDDEERVKKGYDESVELISRMVQNQIIKNNKVFLDTKFKEMELDSDQEKKVLQYLITTATSFVLDKINLSFPDTPVDTEVKKQAVLDRVKDMIILIRTDEKGLEEFRFYPKNYPFKEFNLVKQLKDKGFKKTTPEQYAQKVS